ncbi:MAG: tetratricopeptide repeat protein [Bacteroidota bacterium]
MKWISLCLITTSLIFWSCGGEATVEDNSTDSTASNEEQLVTPPSLNELFGAYDDALSANDPTAAEEIKVQLANAMGNLDNPILAGFFDAEVVSPDPASANNLLQESFSQLTDESTGLLDRKRSQDFLEAVRINAYTNPNDAGTAEWLFKSAEVAQSIGDFETALALYQKILAQFPEGSRAPDATFMIAFTYDENYQDYETARTYYEQFLENYPEDDFADDAQMMLQLLGKSDAEVLESLGQ